MTNCIAVLGRFSAQKALQAELITTVHSCWAAIETKLHTSRSYLKEFNQHSTNPFHFRFLVPPKPYQIFSEILMEDDMAGRLAGKVALISGAGSCGPGWGNGRATATLFAREGAKVFAADLNEEAVETTTEAVFSVLRHLGMLKGEKTVHRSRVEGGPWRRSSGPRASNAGFLVPQMSPGSFIKRGQVLAEIRSLTGNSLERIRSRDSGLIVALPERSWVSPGNAVGTLAVPDN